MDFIISRMSHLSEMRRRIAEDERLEAESHRERDRMSAEDTASRMFIGWVRREQKAMAESDFDASPPQPIPTNDVFDKSRLGLPRSVETGAAQSENAVPQSGVAGPPRAAGGEIPISNRCPRCDRVGHTSDACPFYKGARENHPDASWGDTTPHLQQTEISITSGGEVVERSQRQLGWWQGKRVEVSVKAFGSCSAGLLEKAAIASSTRCANSCRHFSAMSPSCAQSWSDDMRERRLRLCHPTS